MSENQREEASLSTKLEGVSVVIPAFNEEMTIEETVQKTIKVLTDLRVDFEILIIGWR